MKHFLIILTFVFYVINSYAQFSTDFSPKEASDMIALNNSFTFIKLLNKDKKIIPKGYKKVYESEELGLDNQWKMWKNKHYAVISLRGSTSNMLSWLGNLFSAQIPSKGDVTFPDETKLHYDICPTENASIHSGWMLSTLFLSKEIVEKIDEMNDKGVYHFIITGHSQGAAISQLLRAYLESEKGKLISNKNHFKTYAFASPKIGNKAFAHFYNKSFKNTFVINNPADEVPQMPYAPDKKKMFDLNEAIYHYSDSSKSYLKTLTYRLAEKVLLGSKRTDSSYVKMAGTNVYKQLVFQIGKFSLPPFEICSDYQRTGRVKKIGPFKFEDLSKDKLCKALNINKDSKFFQHKPYLYYWYTKRKFR